MDDALFSAREIKEGYPVFFAILPQRLDHFIGELIGKRFLAFIGRHDVIDGGKRPIRIEDLYAEVPEHPKSLRAGYFVYKMGANEQLSCSIWQFAHRVRLPHFIQQRLAHNSDFPGRSQAFHDRSPTGYAQVPCHLSPNRRRCRKVPRRLPWPSNVQKIGF